jgi:hypothetical protein
LPWDIDHRDVVLDLAGPAGIDRDRRHAGKGYIERKISDGEPALVWAEIPRSPETASPSSRIAAPNAILFRLHISFDRRDHPIQMRRSWRVKSDGTKVVRSIVTGV